MLGAQTQACDMYHEQDLTIRTAEASEEVLVDINERRSQISTSSEAGESPLTSPLNPVQATVGYGRADNRPWGVSEGEFRRSGFNSSQTDTDEPPSKLSHSSSYQSIPDSEKHNSYLSAAPSAHSICANSNAARRYSHLSGTSSYQSMCTAQCKRLSYASGRYSVHSTSSEGDICRICHCGRELEQLIRPCRCDGSTKFTHQSCLLSWFQENNQKKNKCELCLYEIKVVRKGIKPVHEWRCPPRALRDIIGVPSIYAVLVFICACIILLVITKGCVSINCLLGYLPFLIAIALAIKYCGCIDYMRIYGRKWLMINEEWRVLEYHPTQYRTTYVIVAAPAPCGSDCKLAELL